MMLAFQFAQPRALADERALAKEQASRNAMQDALDEPDEVARANPEEVEEIIVKGRQYRERPNVSSMFDVRDAHAKGGLLYRQQRYAEAFPYLMNAAKRGFKVSQARVGFIYQQGLGGVSRNPAAAIGWIGVAATRKASPEIVRYYREMRRQVPSEKGPQIDQIVARYVAEYGPDATGIRCDNTRAAGSHISTLKCEHEQEYDSRNVFDRAAIFGASNLDLNPLATDPGL